MKEFMVAAKAAEGVEEEILEFSIGEEEFRCKIPSTARIAMFIATMSDEDTASGGMVAAIFSLLRDVLLDDGYKRLRKLINTDVVSMQIITGGDDLNEDGLVDWIIAQSTGRPTESPVGSSPSQPTGGRRSTGRSPGAGSIS